MAALLKLSKYILLPILSEWCHIADFLRLKLAVMDKDGLVVMNMLKDFPGKFIHNDIGGVRFSMSLIFWLEKKSIQATVFVDTSFLNYLNIQPMWLCQNLISFCRQRSYVTHIEDNIISKIIVPFDLILRNPSFLIDILLRCRALMDVTIQRTSDQKARELTPMKVPLNEVCTLQYLRLSNVFLANGLAPVLRICPNLLEIHCTVLGDNDDLARAAIVWCRNLVCFNVRIRCRRLQFMFAFHFGKQCNTIVVNGADDLLLKTVATYRGGEKLISLTIMRPTVWSHECSEYVNQCCPNLSELIIVMPPNVEEYLRGNVSCFKNLTRLSIHYPRAVEETSLAMLFTQFPLYSYKVILFEYKFALIDAMSTCQCLDLRTAQLTKARMWLIAQFCPLLTELNVSGCETVDDSALVPIFENGKLQVLGATLTSITTVSLLSLCKHCSSDLRILDVSSFSFVEGLLNVVEECRALRELYCHTGEVYTKVYALAVKINRRLSVFECRKIVAKALNQM